MRKRIGMLRVAQLAAVLCGLAAAGLPAPTAKATVIVKKMRVSPPGDQNGFP